VHCNKTTYCLTPSHPSFSVDPTIHSLLRQSVYLSIYLSIYPPTHLLIYPFIDVSVSVLPSFYLFTHPVYTVYSDIHSVCLIPTSDCHVMMLHSVSCLHGDATVNILKATSMLNKREASCQIFIALQRPYTGSLLRFIQGKRSGDFVVLAHYSPRQSYCFCEWLLQL
jgi:hypothetical protein